MRSGGHPHPGPPHPDPPHPDPGPTAVHHSQHQQHAGGPRDLWPRDFGRDGISGLITTERAMRARDVSRPDAEDERVATEVVADLLARIDGRRTPPIGRRPGG